MLSKNYVKSVLNSNENRYIRDIFIHETKPESKKCAFNTFLNFKKHIIPFLNNNFKNEYQVAIQYIFHENMLNIDTNKNKAIEYFIDYVSGMESYNTMCFSCINKNKCNSLFSSSAYLKTQLIRLGDLLKSMKDIKEISHISDNFNIIVDNLLSSYSKTSILDSLKTSFVDDYISDNSWSINIVHILFYLGKIDYDTYFDFISYKKSFNKSISNISSENNEGVKNNTVEKTEAVADNDDSEIKITSSALDELNGMIGLKAVKEQISNLYDLLCFRKITETELNLPELNLNCVFIGNPGTGKTRTAKLYADILYDTGFIKTNKLICVSASDLIAEHIGGTAIKTTNVINKSLGGVLFIDEAYQLTPKHEKDFGRECITTLVREMTEHKNDLVIIFAGYKKEIKEFVDVNPGMKSRITHFINFEDYSVDELFEIFKLNVDNSNLKISDTLESVLKDIFKTKSKDKFFGNARFVENLFQEMILEHSKNIMAKIRNKEINTNDDIIKILDANDLPNIYTSNVTPISLYN